MRVWVRGRAFFTTSALIALGYFGSALTASAAEPTYRFDIPAEPLGQALSDYSQASSQQIIFSNETVAGRKSAALHGRYTSAQALDALLAGTELNAKKNSTGVLMVQSKNVQAASNEAAPPVSAPVEAVIVTGTHLAGVNSSASPVEVYTRDDIERSGSGTLSQFIQTIPQNYSTGGATQNTSLSTVTGTGAVVGYANNVTNGAGINLRGLGTDATITLVDGHRVSAGNLSGNVVDISMIPANAVDRIEIVTDGASAIYGSDAVGGVVNILMRKDFEGAETGFRYAGANGTHELQVDQSLGHRWGSGSAFVSYEYYEQTPLSAADRSYSATALQPTTLLPEQRRNSVWASVDQSVGSDIALFGNANYSNRYSYNDSSRTGLSLHLTDNINSYGGTFGGRATLSATTDLELSATYTASETALLSVTPATSAAQANQHANTSVFSVDGVLRGSAFSLPAGPVQYAIGGQFRQEGYDFDDYLAKSRFTPGRSIGAGFAELRIPVIAGDNRLDLTAAFRYEHYSDFGSTSDPQVGLIWQAAEGLKLRGTYGQSFVAPLLNELNPTPTFDGVFNTSLIAGATPATGNVNALLVEGGNPALGAQTAQTWTAGADWRPDNIPGLSAHATYYGTNFSGRISNGQIAGISPTLALSPQNAAILGPQIANFNPPAAEVATLLAYPGLIKLGSPDLTHIGALIDFRDLNLSEVDVQGIDLDAAYHTKLDDSDLEFGVASTYILTYTQSLTASSPAVSVVDTLYNPTRFKARARAIWSQGAFTGSLFVNYISSYYDVSTSPRTPVSSWTTADFTATYDCRTCSILGGFKATFAVVNLTDENPPYVKNSSLYPINFDGSNASPLGRVFSIQLTKDW